jgi:uncharacterized protein (DUF433 family)
VDGPKAAFFPCHEVAWKPRPAFSRHHYGVSCSVAIPAKLGLIVGMKTKSVVEIDPEIMSGTPCFAGTRVPARTLIDYLEGGDSLEDFLEDFPTVSRKQAVALLEEASELLIAPA